jgi:NADPH2:quinone reductase
MPMNYMTAHLALGRRGALSAGETLLVHGATGGLGSALVQCGKAMGAVVIAVVSSAEKGAVAAALGADEVLASSSWLDDARRLVGGRGVDIVADPVGGSATMDSVRLLATEGRLLVLGFAAGDIPTIPTNRILLKNVDLRGVAWGSLIEHEPDYPKVQWRQLIDWYRTRQISPLDGPSFPLEHAATALGELVSRSAKGKVTLAVRPE